MKLIYPLRKTGLAVKLYRCFLEKGRLSALRKSGSLAVLIFIVFCCKEPGEVSGLKQIITGYDNWGGFSENFTGGNSPMVAAGKIYVSWASLINAFDVNTGTKSWSFESVNNIQTIPLIVENDLFFGGNDGFVYSLDAHTGKQKWKFKAGSAVLSGPSFNNGVVFAECFDGKIFALDASTGVEKWSLRKGIFSSITIVDNVIYFGSIDGSIKCPECFGWLSDLESRSKRCCIVDTNGSKWNSLCW